MTLLIAVALCVLGILGLAAVVHMATWLAIVLLACGVLLVVAPRINGRP